MLSTATAVEVLRNLRRHQAVTLSDGSRGVVMTQLRERVTVLVGAVVQVVNRWDVDPVPSATVEYTEEDLAWFRKPATEAGL